MDSFGSEDIILFMDEASIQFAPTIIRMWSLKGFQPKIKTYGGKKRQQLIGAVDPNEVETIRKLVQEQIKSRTQLTAEELAAQYQQMIQGQSQMGFQNRNVPPPVDREIIQPPQQNLGDMEQPPQG